MTVVPLNNDRPTHLVLGKKYAIQVNGANHFAVILKSVDHRNGDAIFITQDDEEIVATRIEMEHYPPRHLSRLRGPSGGSHRASGTRISGTYGYWCEEGGTMPVIDSWGPQTAGGFPVVDLILAEFRNMAFSGYVKHRGAILLKRWDKNGKHANDRDLDLIPIAEYQDPNEMKTITITDPAITSPFVEEREDRLQGQIVEEFRRNWRVYNERAIMRGELLFGSNEAEYEAHRKELWMRQLKLVD